MLNVFGRIHPLPAVAGLLALTVGSCASVSPRVDAWKFPPVGATWTMAQRNTGSYGKDAQVDVIRGEGTWEGRSVVTMKDSRGAMTIATPNGERLAVVAPNGKPALSWDPPLGWGLPMRVGKEWKTTHRMTMHAAGRTVVYDLMCKVEDHGKVTVAAGTFDAFRVACTNTIGNDETYWLSPRLGIPIKASLRRSAESPLGAGTQDAELVAHGIAR